MIIYMYNIICVTNRMLCRDSFFVRLEKLCKAQPYAIVLREKDLGPAEYEDLAVEVISMCRRYGVQCILHNYYSTAMKLGHRALHVPLNVLEKMTECEKKYFTVLGASCHSIQDAVKAQQAGCTYITAGHVFDTDCKKGLPGRGINFLADVCKSVSIDVYGIGGIDKTNINEVVRTGARGACIMKSAMVCEDPIMLIGELK